jgi:cell division protein FtsB
MNDEQMENLLRKAPAPKAPKGLEERLNADIRLPSAGADQRDWRPRPSWSRRWLPALSFAAILLTCMVAIGVQGNLMTELKQRNDDLRAKSQNLDSLRQASADIQRLRNENQELDRLRKDNAELQKLRGDLAQLSTQVEGLSGLRAQNEQLRMRNAAAPNTVADARSEEDKAKEEADHCVNNLKQIGLAFRIWAGDNGDKYPNDFISMTNELSNWRILQCPSDKAHQVSSWADVAAGNVSYRRVSSGPEADETHPNVVLVECPIHGCVLLSDGSVQRLTPEARQKYLKVVNGVTVFGQ